MRKLCLFVAVVSAISCKKTDNTLSGALPDPSSSGKNFLACKVNGQVHTYEGRPYSGATQAVYFTRYENEFIVSGSNNASNDRVALYFFRQDSLIIGRTYYFSFEQKHYGQYNRYDPSGLQYRTTGGSGWFQFSRLDQEVAAGTFSFDAYYSGSAPDAPTQDTVHITEGRFDILN